MPDIDEKHLLAVFPEQCLKATPDPEFLLNLYDFDMSLCPHQSSARTLNITAPFNLSSRVPELLVWMQHQVCQTLVILFILTDSLHIYAQKHPDRKDDLFTHHLTPIDLWLQTELSRSCCHPSLKITELILTSATLVDFPQFPDIHHLILRVPGLRPNLTMKSKYRQLEDSEYRQHEDSEKWEIYVKYRHIISQFLTDRTRSLIAANQTRFGPYNNYLFVGETSYVSLAKHLLRFLSEDLG